MASLTDWTASELRSYVHVAGVKFARLDWHSRGGVPEHPDTKETNKINARMVHCRVEGSLLDLNWWQHHRLSMSV